MTIICETERLIVRSFEEIDFPNFLKLHQDKTTMKYFTSGVKSDLIAREKFDYIIRHQKQFGYSYWIAFDKGGNFIGQCGVVNNSDKTVNMCFAILKEKCGNGYGYELTSGVINYCFQNTSIELISAIAMNKNLKSQNLLKKLGFKHIKNFFEDGILINYFLLEKNN